jgi:hypothetical protein
MVKLQANHFFNQFYNLEKYPAFPLLCLFVGIFGEKTGLLKR